MSLKFHLFSILSGNTLSRSHDIGILFIWAVLISITFCADKLHGYSVSNHKENEGEFSH